MENSTLTATLPQRDSEVLSSVQELLTSRLPAGWTADLEASPRIGGSLADALLTIVSPTGETASLVVEAKLSITPRAVDALIRQAKQMTIDLDAGEGSREPPLVAARYLPPRVRDRLIETGTNYADATGNVWLSLTSPGLFIRTDGAGRDPVPEKRATRSLRGPAAARIIRSLWEATPPVGIRALAADAGVSPGTVSKIVHLLRSENIIDAGGGPVTAVQRAALIERWAEDYAFSVQNEVSLFLEPRGMDALLDKLRTADFDYAVTGSLAARLIKETAEARLAMIYVKDIDEAARGLQLAPVPSGGNVLLAEPFVPILAEKGWERDGIRYANLAQVAVDLLRSPGRGPQEGEALLRKLTRTTDA